MFDYFRNELTDKLYLRYLESFELTNETLDTTGKDAYKLIHDTYTKNLRSDLKIIDECVKFYTSYKNKEYKHLIKLEKINFNELSVEEFNTLSFFQRLRYKNKKAQAQSEDKKLIKLERKYRKWISLAEEEITEEETESEPEKETKVDVTSEVIEESKEGNITSTGAKEQVEIEENNSTETEVRETALSSKEELNKNGGISLSEGTQMTLETFFNISNEEGKT